MFASKLLNSKFFLTIICIFFLLTRIYKISETPPSVYWDEASIGYNAYSIIQTGQDEWGNFLPIHFRAFGEFKLPIYVYSVAIFVKIFGLNEFSVRLPAVFYSLGVVIITYFLAKKLTGSLGIGLLSSFFISVSPWLFIFSRTGYEATAGLMFYLLGIYLFLKALENKWFMLFSVLSLILSAYSYNSFRIISPLTILILWGINIKVLIRQKFVMLISATLIILSVIPVYRLFVYDAGIARLQTVSSTPQSIIYNYLSHLSPMFLFVSGDKNLRSQQASFGQLYLPELILLPLGFLYIISRKQKNEILLLWLILFSPIPASITKESPHALRTISIVPFLSILSALGTLQVARYSKNYIQVGMVVIFLFLFAGYFINFLNIYPIQSSKDWQYGYKKVYLDYQDQFAKYKRVIISDEYGQPYIFGLFYLKMNPEQFRESVVRNDISNWGFSTVAKFDKFEFGKVDKLLEIDYPSNSLIFASEKDKISGLEPISHIMFLDGTTAFWVYTQ